MKIFIIRHGQTTSDIEGRYGGDYDDHITPLGVKQAKALAEKLKTAGIQMLFVSSRIRAQETAKILYQRLKTGVKTDPDLRERNLYGVLTGMTVAEAQKKFPKEVEMLKNVQNTLPKGEMADDFTRRIFDAFWRISKLEFQTVGIVTHGGVIRRIYKHILHIPYELNVGDCAFFEVEVAGTQVNLLMADGITTK